MDWIYPYGTPQVPPNLFYDALNSGRPDDPPTIHHRFIQKKKLTQNYEKKYAKKNTLWPNLGFYTISKPAFWRGQKDFLVSNPLQLHDFRVPEKRLVHIRCSIGSNGATQWLKDQLRPTLRTVE